MDIKYNMKLQTEFNRIETGRTSLDKKDEKAEIKGEIRFVER